MSFTFCRKVLVGMAIACSSTACADNAESVGTLELDTQLPESMLGTFDLTAEDCAKPGTTTRLTLSPDRFEFYYGYATVDTVARREEGYDVSATLFLQEGQIEVTPELAEYRIEPETEEGDIRFERVYEGSSMSSFVRCEAS